MDNFHDKPGHLIRRARPISTALFAEECAGFDLTSMQHAALAATKADPEVDATRLSALIAFDRPEFPPPPRTLPSRPPENEVHAYLGFARAVTASS